jgi:EmrB/QacA subfamily drug resistance transporter
VSLAGDLRQRPGWTLVATGLGLFVIFLDATIVNVALPAIQHDLGVGESGVQWVVAAYSLTMAAFMMAGGTLGDVRGRRLAFIAGLVVFSLASAACAAANGIAFLTAARAVQGVAAAVVNVSSLALVGAAFPEARAKAKAIGIWTGIAAVGFTIGPAVGGVLTEAIGWRSVFLIGPVIGAIAIVLTVRFVVESRNPAQRGFDLPGQVLFVVGVGALTFGLIQGPHRGWLSAVIVGAFALAGAALAVFVRAEVRSAEPMMDLRVFRDRVYSTALYAAFAPLFSMYGTLLIVTQYFQNVRDYSPEKAGLLTLTAGVPVVVLSPYAGRIVAARGGRLPTLIGLACATAGAGLLAASHASHVAVLTVSLMLLGAAGALAVASATSVAMSAIPAERSGMASGILSTQRGLGSTAGFAIMGSVLAATVAAVLPQRLEPYIPDTAARTAVVDQVVQQANPQAIVGLIGPGKPLPEQASTDQDVLQATDGAFIAGIRLAMLVAFAVDASALVLVWWLFPRRRARAPDAESHRVKRAEQGR